MADSSLDKFSAVPTSQKVVLLVIVMLGIGAAWYFLMFEEVQAKIKVEAARTPKLQAELSAEREVADNLEKYRADIEALRAERDKMRSRLPDNAEIATLLQNIHSQAKIVGLEISRFERAQTSKESLYVRIPVKMVLTGTFQQISSFYFNLGQLKRIVNVENIELTTLRKGEQAEEERLVANCVATTFQYLPDATGGAAKGKSK